MPLMSKLLEKYIALAYLVWLIRFVCFFFLSITNLGILFMRTVFFVMGLLSQQTILAKGALMPHNVIASLKSDTALREMFRVSESNLYGLDGKFTKTVLGKFLLNSDVEAFSIIKESRAIIMTTHGEVALKRFDSLFQEESITKELEATRERYATTKLATKVSVPAKITEKIRSMIDMELATSLGPKELINYREELQQEAIEQLIEERVLSESDKKTFSWLSPKHSFHK